MWRCEEFSRQDTNAHLLWCKGYESLREKRTLGVTSNSVITCRGYSYPEVRKHLTRDGLQGDLYMCSPAKDRRGQ